MGKVSSLMSCYVCIAFSVRGGHEVGYISQGHKGHVPQFINLFVIVFSYTENAVDII